MIPLKTQKRRNGYVETERKWAVGDKFFPAYKEARVYIVSRRAELLREALEDFSRILGHFVSAVGRWSKMGCEIEIAVRSKRHAR